jgi:cysteinyl-tRNA synthetase
MNSVGLADRAGFGRAWAGLALAAVLALPATAEAGAGRAQLLAAKSWAFQLQNVNIGRLAASPYDIVVVDYSHSGSGRTALSRADVARLQRKSDGGRRVVLAYLSIGEAESYRDYWKRGAGASLAGAASAGWKGNYTAKYWSDGWKDIMYRGPSSYLSKIMAAGFDGVYLDRIDAHEKVGRSRGGAKGEMIELVRQISATAKSRDGSFLVVAQNAEELLSNASYRAAIDGIGKEELLYGIGGPGSPNNQGAISYSTRMLQRLKSEGKAVMVIEYLTDGTKIASARKRLQALGFLVYFANRSLDRVRTAKAE